MMEVGLDYFGGSRVKLIVAGLDCLAMVGLN